MASSAPFLIITGHDYRSRRKANIHFIARELACNGPTRVFSFGLSQLSRLKNDPRILLWNQANKIETFDGVDCYLWRTQVHPFNLRSRAFDRLSAAWFRNYVTHVPELLNEWIRQSGTIILESGMPVILADHVRSLNAQARLIYRASDDLKTIGCARFIVDELQRTGALYDGAALVSMRMKNELPATMPSFHVPHGFDPDIAHNADPSPFPAGLHAVSVGSMLFDPDVVRIAAAAFPQVTFHIIGSGARSGDFSAHNVVAYDEMPFLRTIPYIKHAKFGMAPYRASGVAPYLAETSLKLMQYAFFGIPAVCPDVVVGDHPWRFGYKPGDAASIAISVDRAMRCDPFVAPTPPTWAEITERLLNLPVPPRTQTPTVLQSGKSAPACMHS